MLQVDKHNWSLIEKEWLEIDAAKPQHERKLHGTLILIQVFLEEYFARCTGLRNIFHY